MHASLFKYKKQITKFMEKTNLSLLSDQKGNFRSTLFESNRSNANRSRGDDGEGSGLGISGGQINTS